MKVVTFYSYKGGVGRTLAATNFAVYLAKLGLKVIIVDFDLDAPGLDSKFPTFDLPSGQMGLIDYVLRFQREGAGPGPIDEILCSVPISSPRQQYALGLIPAGDYLAEDYSVKLNELDWKVVFSGQRDGVEFFQMFLGRIDAEQSPDVLVVDSRTGFSEIGGLCTQQLADETVIISSLARESVKMTRHLAQVIRESRIAHSLNKEVETKVVVSRVPKPKDIDKLKARCCRLFDVDDTKLFFLFSCPGLEREEFVAMLDTSREDALVANYLQLFQGLDVQIAQESISREIARTEQGILSCPAAEADGRIREMVALYPHPEVYRRAMRFFDLTRRPEEAVQFGFRLLDLQPDDAEAQLNVARFFLGETFGVRHGFISPWGRREEQIDRDRIVAIAERVYEAGQLSVTERIRLADLLEDVGKHARSFQIAKCCLDDGGIEGTEQHFRALGIAARTAMKIGKSEEAARLISGIPVTRLHGGLASVAVQLKIGEGDKEGAFDIIKAVLSHHLSSSLLERAIGLSEELGRRAELEEIIRSSPELEETAMHDPRFILELERHGFNVAELRERASAFRRARHRR